MSRTEPQILNLPVNFASAHISIPTPLHPQMAGFNLLSCDDIVLTGYEHDGETLTTSKPYPRKVEMHGTIGNGPGCKQGDWREALRVLHALKGAHQTTRCQLLYRNADALSSGWFQHLWDGVEIDELPLAAGLKLGDKLNVSFVKEGKKTRTKLSVGKCEQGTA